MSVLFESRSMNRSAKRTRTGLLLLIGIPLLVALVYFVSLGAGNLSKADDLIEDANNHISSADELWRNEPRTVSQSYEEDKTRADRLLKRLSKTDKHLVEAEKSLVNLKKLNIDDDYNKFADKKIDAVKEYELGDKKLKDYFKKQINLAAVFILFDSGWDKYRQAFDQNNEIISLNNRRKYGEVKNLSAAANRTLDEATGVFQNTDNLDKSLNIIESLTLVNKLRELINIESQMSEAGQAGRTTQYNNLVERMNNMSVELSEAEDKVLKTVNDLKNSYMKLPDDSLVHFAEASALDDKANKYYEKNIE